LYDINIYLPPAESKGTSPSGGATNTDELLAWVKQKGFEYSDTLNLCKTVSRQDLSVRIDRPLADAELLCTIVLQIQDERR